MDRNTHLVARTLIAADGVAAYCLFQAAARRGRNARQAGVGPHLSGTTLARLDGIAAFAKSWKVPFPIPPRLAAPPMGFVTTSVTKPIDIVHHSADLLVLDFWIPAGRSAFDLLPGILDHVNPHRSVKGQLRRASTRKRSRIPHAVLSATRRDDRISVRITHPESMSFAEIRRAAGPLLGQSSVATKDAHAKSYKKMFRVLELTKRGWHRGKIARKLKLEDSEGRGLERVSMLRKIYRHLAVRFGLPTP
jgi:hypothetical protein